MKVKNHIIKVLDFLSKYWKVVIELIIAIATISALYLQYDALREQKITSAWQLITTKSVGNSGKVEALEFLAKQGVPLVGIDLSKKNNCTSLSKDNFIRKEVIIKIDQNEEEDVENHKKYNKSLTYLQGLNLSKNNMGEIIDLSESNFNETYLYNAHFCDTIIQQAQFNGSYLQGTKFNQSDLSYTKFNGSDLYNVTFHKSNLQKAQFHGSLLTNVDFNQSDLRWAEFHGSELRGVKFDQFNDATFFDEIEFQNNYIADLYITYIDEMSLPTAPSPWEFRFVMKDGSYQRNPKNIRHIKQEIYNKKDVKNNTIKYFIHPVKSDTPDPSQEIPIS